MAIILGKVISATIPASYIDVDLGSKPKSSGNFTITGSFNTGKPVLITLTPNPIDDAEWDIIDVVGFCVSGSTIQCYWTSNTVVSGIKNFTYRQV
jgi:hypothetical protein